MGFLVINYFEDFYPAERINKSSYNKHTLTVYNDITISYIHGFVEYVFSFVSHSMVDFCAKELLVSPPYVL